MNRYEVLIYGTASVFARVDIYAYSEEEAKELAETEWGLGDFEIDDIDDITEIIVEDCVDEEDE
jgi:ABC-type phosphonate transport system ATPase subunit